MARVPLLASRVEQRAVIRFFWSKGLSTGEIHNECSKYMVTSVLICRWLKVGAANFLTAEQVWLTTSGLGGILLRLTMTLSRKLISSYRRTVGYPYPISFFTPEFHEVRFIQWCMIISFSATCLFEAYRNHFVFTLC